MSGLAGESERCGGFKKTGASKTRPRPPECGQRPDPAWPSAPPVMVAMLFRIDVSDWMFRML
jgi:hypothetical protein